MKSFILRDNAVRERAIAYLSALPLAPLQEVEIQLYDEARSNQANRRYWAILQSLAEATGKRAEAWHYFFKRLFIGFDEIEVNGVIVEVPHSSARLPKKKFTEYVTRVEVYIASDLGINLYGIAS